MATYADIASMIIERKREDGSLRRFEFVLSERDGIAASATLPIEGNPILEEGAQGDDILKPVKPSVLRFRLKDKTDLAAKLIKADTRQFKITVTELESGWEEFEGFIKPDQHKYDLFRGVQTVQLMATGELARTDQHPAENTNRTWAEFFSRVGTDIELERPVDFYTRWRYNGQSISDPIPDQLRFNESQMIGAEDGTRLDVMNQFLQQHNMQVFQLNGRLAVADVYERLKNPGGMNKYTGGAFERSQENHIVLIGRANSLKYPSGRRSFRTGTVVQEWKLRHRRQQGFRTRSGTITTRGDRIENRSQAFMASGDVLTVAPGEWAGSLVLSSSFPPGEDTLEATVRVGVVRFESAVSGHTYYYNHDEGEWQADPWYRDVDVFSTTPGASLAWHFFIGGQTVSLPPIPDNEAGFVFADTLFDVIDIDQGIPSMVTRNELSTQVVRVDWVEDPGHIFYRYSYSNGQGKSQSFPLHQADQDTFTLAGHSTAQQTLEYWDGNSFEEAEKDWIDDGEDNAAFGLISGRRKAALLLGSPDRIELTLRDTQEVNLLTVFAFDNGEETEYYAPVCIQHDFVAGYYKIWMRPGSQLAADFSEGYSLDQVDGGGGSSSSAIGKGPKQANEWSQIRGKPFSSIGDRLSVVNNVLVADQQTEEDFTTALKNKLEGLIPISQGDMDNWNEAYSGTIVGVTGDGNSQLIFTRKDSSTYTVPTSHDHAMHEVQGLSVALNNLEMGKEDAFTKNSAFNKNFGTTNDSVMRGDDLRVQHGEEAFSWDNHQLAGYLIGGLLPDQIRNNSQLDSRYSQLGHSHGYSTLPISAGQVANWETAYDERGSMIAGPGLSWNGGMLSVENHEHSFEDITGQATFAQLPISQFQVDNWTQAFGWGDHQLAGYILNGPLADQVRNNAALDLRYSQLGHRHPWSELDNVPDEASRWPSFAEVVAKPNTATRWPAWNEVTDKPTNLLTEVEANALYAPFSHLSDTDNPHSVTKADVGLGSVSNYSRTHYDARYAAIAHSHSWNDITSGIPDEASRWPSFAEVVAKPNTATRWPQFSEVTNKPSTLAGYGITDSFLTEAEADVLYAPFDHNHSAGDITSGTVAYARLPFSSSQVNNWDEAHGWGNHASAGYAINGTADHQVRNNDQLDLRYTIPVGNHPTNPAPVAIGPGEGIRFYEGSDINIGLTKNSGRVEVTISYQGSAGSNRYISSGEFVMSGGIQHDQELVLNYNTGLPSSLHISLLPLFSGDHVWTGSHVYRRSAGSVFMSFRPTNNSTNTNISRLRMYGNSSNSNYYAELIQYNRGGSDQNGLRLRTNYGSSKRDNLTMYADGARAYTIADGRLGVNVTPTYSLDVGGTARFRDGLILPSSWAT